MSQYQVSIAVDAVITALGAFLQPFVGSAQIVRGQTNRVPPPLDSYVLLTELHQQDLETSTVRNDPANSQIVITGPAQINIQVDFYGPSSGDQCKAVKTVYRTPYAPAQFPDGIKPLYCSDGIQAPLTTAEQQYEARWTITASLQYNPVVTIPQQSAKYLAVNILEDIK
jgi:hypothetical protein